MAITRMGSAQASSGARYSEMAITCATVLALPPREAGMTP